MKKLFMLLLLAALPTFASAQLQVIPKPSLSLGVGGGFSAITGGDITSSGAGFRNVLSREGGINFGAKATFTIPAVPLRFIAHFTRHNLTTNFVNTVTVTGPVSATSTTTGKNDTPVNTFGAGVELVLLPTPIISPYASLDYSFASISSGTVSNSRQGIGIGLGTDLSIPGLPLSFGLDLKYRMLNLIGKVDGEPSSNIAQVSVYAVYKLF
jgi:hypothetical protein